MRKIIASEYVTVDGVFEDPGGAENTGFGGWSFEFWNDEAARYKRDELFASSTLLLGRVTYEGFAKAWPTMEGTGEFGTRMNGIQKVVVSTTLKHATWSNSTIINENAAEQIRGLKQQAGQDILVAGSGELLDMLLRNNLVDEVRLLVHPVVLGRGEHLFKAGTKVTFKLREVKNFTTGIVALHYQPTKVR